MATRDAAASCIICANDLNALERLPVALPCGHSFCLTCVWRLKTSDCAICPHCRQNFAAFALPDVPGAGRHLPDEFGAGRDLTGSPSMSKPSKEASSGDEMFVGCSTHKHPYFYLYWSTTQKVFYCRYCILEINIQASGLKDINDAIPLIRTELESKATSASEGLRHDMDKHKEEREKAVEELEKTENFEKKVHKHIADFQQFIQEVDTHNSRLRQKQALVEEITGNIPEISSDEDMPGILRYWTTLAELQRSARATPRTRPTRVLRDIVQELTGTTNAS